jgi:hypothetical protein
MTFETAFSAWRSVMALAERDPSVFDCLHYDRPGLVRCVSEPTWIQAIGNDGLVYDVVDIHSRRVVLDRSEFDDMEWEPIPRTLH